MTNFSLLQQLGDDNQTDKVPTPKIEYQQYELVVEKQEVVINIPKRVSSEFETAVSRITEKLDRRSLRKLLREFRGTRT